MSAESWSEGEQFSGFSLEGSSEDSEIVAPGEQSEEETSTPLEETQSTPLEETSGTFTPEEREYFKNALRIGFHESTEFLFGHKICVKTTNVDEDLQVADIIKQWAGTAGLQKAYRTARVAASLVSLDDKPFYIPLNEDDSQTIVRRKFDLLLKYNPLFVDEVYKLVTDNEAEIAEILLEKLGKSSG